MAGLIQKTNDPEKKQEAEVVLKYISARIKKNRNFLAVFTGGTGSGKSYSCLRMAEIWYDYYFENRNFPLENICFSVEELVKRLRHGNFKKGDLFIVEEVGIGANAKNFQSKTNKALQFILQSFRSLNLVVLFNTPHFAFFDKSARMLMHSHFQTAGIDTEKQEATLKPLFLSCSQSSDKIYKKYLRVRDTKTGRITKITRCILKKPTQHLIDPYEERKQRFVTSLIADFDDDNQLEQQKKHKLKELTPRQAQVFEYLNMGKTTGEIAILMELPAGTISTQKNYIRNKGYVWKIAKNPINIKKMEENP